MDELKNTLDRNNIPWEYEFIPFLQNVQVLKVVNGNYEWYITYNYHDIKERYEVLGRDKRTQIYIYHGIDMDEEYIVKLIKRGNKNAKNNV